MLLLVGLVSSALAQNIDCQVEFYNSETYNMSHLYSTQIKDDGFDQEKVYCAYQNSVLDCCFNGAVWNPGSWLGLDHFDIKLALDAQELGLKIKKVSHEL